MPSILKSHKICHDIDRPSLEKLSGVAMDKGEGAKKSVLRCVYDSEWNAASEEQLNEMASELVNLAQHSVLR